MIEMSSGTKAPTMGLGINQGTGGGEGVADGCRLRAQGQNQASGSNNSQQQQQQVESAPAPVTQQQQQQQQQVETSQQQQQPSSPQQRQQATGFMARSKKDNCCLWLCCCVWLWCCRICPCFHVGTGNSGGGPNDRLKNKKDRPDTGTGFDFLKGCSVEEVLEWGSSFEKLIKNSHALKLFRAFLLSEFSQDNIDFWLDCEKLKRETEPKKIKRLARYIHDKYISCESPREVSLDSPSLQEIQLHMEHPTPNMFDSAQEQIYKLMLQDTYPRFVKSKLYKDAVQWVSEADQASDKSKPGKPKPGKNGTDVIVGTRSAA